MLIAYKYRLYPNKEQREYFAKCFGCVRFIYNRMLSDKIDYYKETKKKLNNTPAQYKKEFEWLKEVDSLALANAQVNLQTAYNNFFKRPEVGFPKFKSKKNHYYSYITNNQGGNIYMSDRYIKLPKIGLVRVKKHRNFEGLIKSVTVSKTPSNKYYVSVLVNQEEKEKLPKTNNQIGIDLGLKEFAITSDGEMIENPKYLRKSEKRLRKLQKDLSRCKKGSKKLVPPTYMNRIATVQISVRTKKRLMYRFQSQSLSAVLCCSDVWRFKNLYNLGDRWCRANS